MKGIIIGARYKLARHPDQPMGIAKTYYPTTKEVLVEWDNKSLIPPSAKYSEDCFANGTFEFVDYGDDEFFGGGFAFDGEIHLDIECSHEWTSYTGLRETYEYCKKCDQKKNQ